MAILTEVPASGDINIIPSFNAADSADPDFDADHSRLIALFDEAELRYEDIIKDVHPLTVVFWYEDLGQTAQGNDILGLCSNVARGGNPDRVTMAEIRIDTRVGVGGAFRDWFIDETPDNDDEFAMVRTDYRNLSSADQTSFFNGSPPDMFETGYIGAATDTDAMGRTDMLSVIMHEIGHALGVSSGSTDETADGDYDINPGFLNGAVMAVNHAPGDIAHLAGDNTLMAPGRGAGWRAMPSQTDLFSMARVQQYSYIWLTDREYLGGTDLNVNSNWIGGYAPNIVVNGYVRPNMGVTPYAVTSGYMGFRNLSILEGAAVTTDYTIDVWETTTIGGPGAGTSRLRIQSSGQLNTVDLDIDDDGLKLFGGSVNVTGEATVFPFGTIIGQGTLSVTDRLSNNGLIAADGGLLLLTTPSSEPVWDLSGFTTSGEVEAIDGDIDIQGAHSGSFLGTMRIGRNRRISMDSTWVLDPPGDLFLEGSSDPSGRRQPAELYGADTVIAGEVVATGETEILGVVEFKGGDVPNGAANVHMPAASDTLTISALATFHTGAYWGNGTLKQANDFIVEGGPGTRIVVSTYDWGNSEIGQSNDTLVDGTTFTIDSETTGTPDNEYRGVITLQNGTLAVNTTSGWTLAGQTGSDLPKGTLHLSNRGDGNPPAVEGVQLTVGGSVWATGGLGVISVPFVTTPTAIVSPGPGAEIELRGATTWDGGNIFGEGGIRQIGDATVVGLTEIATQYYDWDGNDAAPSRTTIDPGVTLRINAPSIENGGPESFDGTVDVNGGWLEVNGVASWTLGGGARMNMDGSGTAAILAGAPVNVLGQVDVVGIMNEFQSQTTFYSTAVVTVNEPDARLNLNGFTTYRGGQYTGLGVINQSANARVREATTIDVGIFDMDGLIESSFLNLEASLTLNVDQVDGDNVFDGLINVDYDGITLTVNTSSRWVMNGLLYFGPASGGELHVAGDLMEHRGVVDVASGELVFDADVAGPGVFTGDGEVVFNGSYAPGASAGLGSFEGDVRFGDAGSLLIELGGTLPTEFDRLDVGGHVILAGDLIVSLIDGYDLQLGHEFLFIEATSLFDQFNGLGDGDSVGTFGPLSLHIDYRDNGTVMLTAEIALPGDLNEDGFVGQFDLDIVLAQWGNSGLNITDPRADPTGDGFVGQFDLDYVLASWGQGTPPSPPVPEPATLGIFALCGFALSRRKPRSR